MFDEISGMVKQAEEAKKKMEVNHKESVALLTEIRDALREVVKALKGE